MPIVRRRAVPREAILGDGQNHRVIEANRRLVDTEVSRDRLGGRSTRAIDATVEPTVGFGGTADDIVFRAIHRLKSKLVESRCEHTSLTLRPQMLPC